MTPIRTHDTVGGTQDVEKALTRVNWLSVSFYENLSHFKDPADWLRFAMALRKAGLPEAPGLNSSEESIRPLNIRNSHNGLAYGATTRPIGTIAGFRSPIQSW